jgi:hypothetical protein
MHSSNSLDLADHKELNLSQVVPQSAFPDADAAAIAEHHDYLLGIEDSLVEVFYDALYSHAVIEAVFEDGERPAREQTLRTWWRRSIDGPIDHQYMLWMTFVGVVHIRRRVKNPMMVSAMTVISDHVHQRARAELDADAVEKLQTAFSHLTTTIVSLISESFTQSYIGALRNLAGLDESLTARMLAIEVKDLEAKGRAALG